MDERLLNLGIGGVVVFLVIVLWKVITPKRMNGASGDRSVEFWDALIRKIVKEEIEEQSRTVLAAVGEIRRDTERIRVMNHDLVNAMLPVKEVVERLVVIVERLDERRRR